MRTNLGETPQERRVIESIWAFQDRLPGITKHLKEHLRNGEFKVYTEHLADMAGFLIALAEEIADHLLTDGEKDALGVNGED